MSSEIQAYHREVVVVKQLIIKGLCSVDIFCLEVVISLNDLQIFC